MSQLWVSAKDPPDETWLWIDPSDTTSYQLLDDSWETELRRSVDVYGNVFAAMVVDDLQNQTTMVAYDKDEVHAGMVIYNELGTLMIGVGYDGKVMDRMLRSCTKSNLITVSVKALLELENE